MTSAFIALSLLRFCIGIEKKPTYDKYALFVLSLVLLVSESLLTGFIFLYVACLTYFSLRWGLCRRNSGLVAITALMIAPLFFFKYSGFVSEETGKWSSVAWYGLIPMGISFYTFQSIGMVVDLRNQSLGKTPMVRVFNFLSFFPQIVAGPIERSSDLMPQMDRFEFRIRWSRLESALSWITLGLFFKIVLADNLASTLGKLSETGENPAEVGMRILGLGFRIYFDFSGYSFIALGLAKLLGVNLTLNFRSPYLASSLQEFWRRWHITLSTWIRDYLYIPMGGGRTRRWPIVVLVVFVLSGAWHGAGWNFLLWGAIHGFGLIFWRICSGKIPNGVIGWLLTQTVVFIAWLPFFTKDISDCLSSVLVMFNPESYLKISVMGTIGLFDSRGDFLVFVVLIALSFLVLIMEFLSIRNSSSKVYSLFQRSSVRLIMVFLIVVIGSTSEGEFVYFNF
ncbi:MBOAT family protein [bacterium]|nr:MBOAT family protein [bacterium]